MKLEQQLRQAPKLEQVQKISLEQKLLEDSSIKIEEIPLFSLHKIKSRINDLKIDPYLKTKLIINLLGENCSYREKTGTNRYCLTFKNISRSLSIVKNGTFKLLEINIKKGKISDTVLEKTKNKCLIDIEKAKEWFDGEFNNLFYDMNGEIPGPVINKLRERFNLWARKKTEDAFELSLNDLLISISKKYGIDSEDPEEIWNKLKKK